MSSANPAAGLASPPSFVRIGPAGAPTPLVCAVPHAGRDYPPGLIAASAVPRPILEDLEDRHADRLIEGLVATGAVAIVARAPRALIDLNRGPEDIEPTPGSGRMPSLRARQGLGLIPRRIGRRELWRTPPDPATAAARLAAVHAPYHAAIDAALAAAVAAHGTALLIDCHSMPSLVPAGATLVVGDRHGASAMAGVAAAMAMTGRAAGYRAAVNAPYAGAYTLLRHGRPLAGVHAVQIEIDRACYLAADRRATGPGLAAATALLTAVAHAGLATIMPDEGAVPIAAE